VKARTVVLIGAYCFSAGYFLDLIQKRIATAAEHAPAKVTYHPEQRTDNEDAA
jgi:hypothetical protein